jgi:glutathione S-transferase
MGLIYHLAFQKDWDDAVRSGDYRASTKGRTLEEQGFIHGAAKPSQVDQVANSFYVGDTGLIVLIIDEGKVRSEVRHDPVPGFDTALPHIYGPLNLDAVVSIKPLSVGDDGDFHFEP